MRRSVKRWAPMDRCGRIPLGVVPTDTRRSCVALTYAGETVVPVTITYDDGRPSRSGAKRTKGGRRG